MNKNMPSWLKHIDFIILDILCLVISFVFSCYFRHGNLSVLLSNSYKEMMFIMILANIVISFFGEIYKNVLTRGYFDEANRSVFLDITSFLLVIFYLFSVKTSSEISRLSLFLTYILYSFISYVVRIIYKKILVKNKKDIKSANKSLLIICENYFCIKETVENIYNNSLEGYQIKAVCLLKNTNKKYKDIEIVSINNLLKYISTNWVDDILLICDYRQINEKILNGIKDSRIPLHVKIDILDNQTINKIGNYKVVSSITTNYKESDLALKKIIDVVGSLIGCIITSMLFIIIAPMIYIKSPGPIIYKSDRIGKNGKKFKFYKFRSMVLNADDLKQDLAKQNRLKDGMMFKVDNDPRIIPGIGEFIRKTSIDEFPQFFNVLKGDMSLVGTRPPTLDEWNKYSPYYRSRLAIKPGITGLWQVSGRSNITNFDEVVRLDNEYINNWSISLDIKILFKTVIKVLKKEGSM